MTSVYVKETEETVVIGVAGARGPKGAVGLPIVAEYYDVFIIRKSTHITAQDIEDYKTRWQGIIDFRNITTDNFIWWDTVGSSPSSSPSISISSSPSVSPSSSPSP